MERRANAADSQRFYFRCSQISRRSDQQQPNMPSSRTARLGSADHGLTARVRLRLPNRHSTTADEHLKWVTSGPSNVKGLNARAQGGRRRPMIEYVDVSDANSAPIEYTSCRGHRAQRQG